MKKIAILFLLFFSSNLFAQEDIISELKFTGLKRTKESFLKRLIKTKINTVYDSILVSEDVERLKRLPGIASASYTITQDNTTTILEYAIVENFTIIPGLRIATANDGSFSYRISAFEFNLFGNNQLLGGFYEKNIFNSYGAFWEHPFLFSDKLGVGLSYQDRTTQEPVFLQKEKKTIGLTLKV